MIADGMITGLYASSGQQIGITLGGYIYVPSNQGGIIMQDANGTLHLLSMGTDGRLTSQTVTL